MPVAVPAVLTGPLTLSTSGAVVGPANNPPLNGSASMVTVPVSVALPVVTAPPYWIAPKPAYGLGWATVMLFGSVTPPAMYRRLLFVLVLLALMVTGPVPSALV